MGTIFIVGTPIGNLGDITLRALETLKKVDCVYAEDTRVAGKLLAHYGIKKSVERYDGHSHAKSIGQIAKGMERGEQIALVTDAGTPGISDPGAHLVNSLLKELPECKIVPIPGVSAVATLLSVCGINTDQFTFLGYPPHKKGRATFFKQCAEITVRPLVLYESPHRILKTLETLMSTFGAEHQIIVGRELTKIHEEIFRGTLREASLHFKKESRGEFTLIIA